VKRTKTPALIFLFIAVLLLTGCSGLAPIDRNTPNTPAGASDLHEPAAESDTALPNARGLPAAEEMAIYTREANGTETENIFDFADEAYEEEAQQFHQEWADAMLIGAIWATPEAINSHEAYEEFTEYGEGPQRIMFISGTVVTDFRFIALGFNEAELYFYEDGIIYTFEELLPERPFLVNWRELGMLPHRGVRFVDGLNRVRYFYITLCMTDGQVLLEEFWPGVSVVSG